MTATTAGDEAGTGLSRSNTERQIEALRRKIRRQHRWRAQVWADCEIRIRAMNSKLQDLGRPPQVLAEYDFESDPGLVALALAGDADEADE